MKRTIDHDSNMDGLRAVLADLCHHAEYRIYVNGQYVESIGSLGSNAQHALEFWQRRHASKRVEVLATRCTLANCERGRR